MKRLFVMFNQVLTCLLTALLAFGPWQYALAATPDDFVDDSSIYIGTPSVRPKPNVLILIDTSRATLDIASGNVFDPTFTYPSVNGVNTWDIYSGDNQGDFTKIAVANSTNALENLTSDACAAIIRTTLVNAGTYSGSGTNAAPNIKNGTCSTGPNGAVYALGNYLNYLSYTPPPAPADIDGDTVPDTSDLCTGHDDRVNSDSDGIPDGCDNCPVTANASQADADGDTVGNDCDRCPGANDKVDANSNGQPDCLETPPPPDLDGDGVADNVDNCPPTLCTDRGMAAVACANPDQLNSDGLDPFGDVCDLCSSKDDRLVSPPGCGEVVLPDADGDGVPDASDNCPSIANTAQTDTDSDTNGGDACDPWPTCADHRNLDAASGDTTPDACGHSCTCGTPPGSVVDLCEGNDTLGDADANGICGDQRPPCTAPTTYVMVTYSGKKYLLVRSHVAATSTNRPGKTPTPNVWALVGAGDTRAANYGAWANGTCYVLPEDYCKPAKPNKDGCVLLLPNSQPPVVDTLPVPAALFAAAMPAAAAGIAALLTLDAWLTPAAEAAVPVGTATETQRKIIHDALALVVGNARYAVNFGAVTYGSNQKGANVLADVASLNSDAAFNTFITAIPGPGENDGWPTISSNSVRPLSSALYDAGYYFGAQYDDVTIGQRIPNGVINQCGYNHIIVITNGLPNNDGANPMPATIRDADGDGYGDEASGGSADYGLGDHYLDDTAAYLYNNHGIKTHTVLAFQPSDPLVEHTAAMGHGKFYNAYDAQELAAALTKLLTSILLEADTAFVAPVVPASTTNRTISSDRVYLGLFKPQLEQPWLGNVKKYRVGNGDQLIDSQGNPATNASSGEFIAASRSYWGTAINPATNALSFKCFDGYRTLDLGDGGIVGCGGLGGTLAARNLVSDPRHIYTYPSGSTSTALTHADNAFATGNAKLTTAMLDVANASELSRIIRFVQGFDPDSVVANDQRSWLLGDVLHAKPLVFNYTNYPGSAEGTCPSGGADWPSNPGGETFNSSILFVGANDGMLHAFRDCDGRELWGFIPPELLKSVKKLADEGHYYYVDSSPVSYVHDANNDNLIDADAGDRVILIFGLRRGGSSNDLADAGPWGGYYAIDVSRPTAPVFLWKVTNQTSNMAMLGETWSQLRMAKIRDGGAVKVVAFIAGGYDKNEDLRFGATQTFPDTTDDTPGDTTIVDAQYDDGGLLSGAGKRSSGTSAPYYPDSTHLRGRGIYAIEIAELEISGGSYTPNFTHTGAVLWHYDHADNGSIDFSLPSDLTVVTDNSAFAQKIYVGDTGGRLWRFDVSSSTIGSWAGNIIFDANSGTGSDVGRKFFYRPAVAYVNGLPMLWFGSGDRAHPLNHDVVDRMYMLIDRGQITSDGINETRMTDLTLNQLQDGNPSNDNELLCRLGKLTGDPCAGFTLNPPYYGWFIKMNWDYDTNDDGTNDSSGGAASDVVGEKVLAAAVMFNREAFYTTYSPYPDPTVNDPCQAGNLGTSRLYHMNFETGESVYNYDIGNDTSDNMALIADDPRASIISGKVLLRADRMRTLGEGIPSGIVTLIDASGNVTMMISTSNRVDTYNAPDVRLISPVYWINW